ncbi:profilin-like [Diadema antillarum]|uniref:profilin-like n=2 Tax=Diadema antillarum TaxID=105358 RepID=UPI003A855347
MSWDSYIDNLISQSRDASGTGHIDRACIFGLDGGAMWTTPDHSNSLKPQGQELANLARCFKSSDYTSLQAGGVWLEGEKYQFLRAEGDIVLAKKKGNGAISLQASKTAIIAAHCPEGGQQGNANKGVGVVAEYLSSMNM